MIFNIFVEIFLYFPYQKWNLAWQRPHFCFQHQDQLDLDVFIQWRAYLPSTSVPFSVVYTKITMHILILYTFYSRLRATTFFSLHIFDLFCSPVVRDHFCCSQSMNWYFSFISLCYYSTLILFDRLAPFFEIVKFALFSKSSLFTQRINACVSVFRWYVFFVCVWFHFAQQKSQSCIERMEKRLSGDSLIFHRLFWFSDPFFFVFESTIFLARVNFLNNTFKFIYFI